MNPDPSASLSDDLATYVLSYQENQDQMSTDDCKVIFVAAHGLGECFDA